ncbi:hypothetical protein Taro_030676 [Colocasia esculenta]|uniref:Fe2OG dioxygenase domain-containing protein n=1 Tax=Colocasia esculenta TaxID=4460 RepID=A0A843VWS9_COLES|nr:hypothetical protein [Colocasia esculenta]
MLEVFGRTWPRPAQLSGGASGMEEERGGRSGQELEEEKRRALEAVFGESSDDDGGGGGGEGKLLSFDASTRHHGQEEGSWERVEGIRGLWLCRDFLSLERQEGLLETIEKEGWFSQRTHNQAMRFGDLPQWATELSNLIQEAASLDDSDFGWFDESITGDQDYYIHPMPGHLLWREPLFDQLIVNVYEPGEGICAHVDLMRFEDGIAIVSLQSECVMHFSPVEQRILDAELGKGHTDSSPTRIPVLLTPGSLVVMSGEARYLWKHEINRKPGFQVWKGEELLQRKRTSITLRKLCPSS